jgi:hypothetical protein
MMLLRHPAKLFTTLSGIAQYAEAPPNTKTERIFSYIP